MRAIHYAQAWYESAGLNFANDVAEYLRDGYIISTPTFFAMVQTMRPTTEKPETFEDLETVEKEEATTWFVLMAVGELKLIFKLLPFDLPRIAFCRRWKKELKIYDFELFKQKVGI